MGVTFVHFSVATFTLLSFPLEVENLGNVLHFIFFSYSELREQVLPELKELVKQQVKFFDI